MRIGFLTAKNANDKGVWSGIVYQMHKALERNGNTIEFLGPAKPIERIFLRWYAKIQKVLIGHSIDPMHSNVISNAYAKIFDRRIEKLKIDLIIAPAGSTEIAHLKTSVPIIYTTDATFNLLDGYYKNFSNYSKKVKNEINLIEKMALDKAAHISYPSEWAKNSSVNDYGISPEKISVISYGANLEDLYPDVQPKNILQSSSINLLFLGIDWERKGGIITYQVLKELAVKYSNINLIICGCNPAIEFHPNIQIIPFLDKNKNEDYYKFYEILNKSHFLILPSQKECFGIVYLEASAYGIPSFAMNTGGVTGAVKNEINGHVFEEKDLTIKLIEKIEYYISNPDQYNKLSQSCIEYYKNEANWDLWAQKLIQNFKLT